MVAEAGELNEDINSFMGVIPSPNPNASDLMFEILNMQNWKGGQHTNIKCIT